MTLFGGLVFTAFLTPYTTFVCCVVFRMFQLEGVAAAAAVAEGWGSKITKTNPSGNFINAGARY